MRSNASALGLALLLTACAGGQGRADAPVAGYGDYAETGLASWYGEEVAGNRTASGERFDPSAITVAHRTLPLGSLVEVTDLETGRSIVARVNDRGPGRADRLIDLSRGAAQLLGTDRHPLSPVRVRSLNAGSAVALRRPMMLPAAAPAFPASATGRYAVQIASFSSEARARALADRLGADVVEGPAGWRVRMGPFDAAAAKAARDAVAARGYGDARILPAD